MNFIFFGVLCPEITIPKIMIFGIVIIISPKLGLSNSSEAHIPFK